MRIFGVVTSAAIGLGVLVGTAQAKVRILVDVGSQTMRVSSDEADYLWPVSTARQGFNTPRGTYGVTSMQRMHYSRKYDNAPMPYSIFFSGGYAIHGTYETRWLGRAASHGCVRLAPDQAAELYRLVRAEGASITIAGTPAGETRVAAAERRHPRRARVAVPGIDDEPFWDDPPLAPGDDWRRDAWSGE